MSLCFFYTIISLENVFIICNTKMKISIETQMFKFKSWLNVECLYSYFHFCFHYLFKNKFHKFIYIQELNDEIR